MPIEFHCSGCHALLRVPDGSAGRQAKCPQCGWLLDIPADSIAGPTAGHTTNPFADPPPQTHDPQNPFQPPSSTAWQQAPADPAVMWKIARSRVAGPAIGMMVYASLALLLAVVNTVFAAVIGVEEAAFGPPPRNEAERIDQQMGFVGVTIAVFAIYGTLLIGAMQMKRLQSYGLAIAASILAMLPCSLCCPLGLPFGIWSLVVLFDHNVKMMFGSSYKPPAGEPANRLQV